MRHLPQLLDNNRRWAAARTAAEPDFFRRLAAQQAPQYLWIGCADSRVPANEIVGLAPGELFVHRNVANLVIHTDLNCLAVLQFAVDVLRVRHVIVCGHYGCGGVRAALESQSLGLIDNWLLHLRDLHDKHRARLAECADRLDVEDRFCEINVVEQAANVCKTSIVQQAWARGQELAVHSWVYGLSDGLLRDLGVCATDAAEANQLVEGALAGLLR